VLHHHSARAIAGLVPVHVDATPTILNQLFQRLTALPNHNASVFVGYVELNDVQPLVRSEYCPCGSASWCRQLAPPCLALPMALCTGLWMCRSL
jgi:hypothetical protein